MALGDVRGYHLQDFLNTQAGKSKSQVVKIRGTLVQMFERAEIDRLIEYSPARKLVLPEATEESRRHLSDEERAALFEVLRTHQAQYMGTLHAAMRTTQRRNSSAYLGGY